MAAAEVTENLLLTIRKSPLNFFISETPYSVQICLRKRFRKDAVHSGISLAESPVIENYIEVIKNMEKEIEVLKSENDSLEKENGLLRNAGKDSLQTSVKQKATLDSHSDEIKMLKGAIEKSPIPL